MSRTPSMPAKIVLKSTTSQTLSDRFTELAKEKLKSPPQVNITGIRNNQAQIAQASLKNRRFAAQLERRTGLQSMMKQGKTSGNLKNRLGTPNGVQGGNLRNRLGSPRGQGGRLAQRGNQRGQMRGRGRGRGFLGRGRGNFGGRGGSFRGRGAFNTRGAFNPRGGRGGSQQRGKRGQNIRGSGRGGSGRGGRGRGRGRGGRGGTQTVTREMLDSDIDVYMSGTGKELDAELEEYMKQVDDN